MMDAEGCSSDCMAVLNGWYCVLNPALGRDTCYEYCGDGRVVGSEICDDITFEGCLEGC